VDENLLPKLTRAGYSMQPNLAKLARMTNNQLSRVEDFQIQNEFVKIQFQKPVDLREADLDKIVHLN